MSYSGKMQKSHLYSVYFAPRGRDRIYDLGMQIAQLHLSPFDQIIGIIGEPGSGKSMLVKGMFPGLELSNDDNGVNVRPLPLLEQDSENMFYSPHTYHVDIRFETGFTQLHTLADAVQEAVRRGKRVVIEHFELIQDVLGRNADLIIAAGEEVLVTRPTIFGPHSSDVAKIVQASLPYRKMAHTAEDLCERYISPVAMANCQHDDIRHGFIMAFPDQAPDIDLEELERKVQADIAADLPITYLDERHITIGGVSHYCTGPRTHVSSTGKIEGFRLMKEFVYDPRSHMYLLIGRVGEMSEDELDEMNHLSLS